MSLDEDKIRLDYKPNVISLTMTSRCNLRCVMCDHAFYKIKNQDFDWSLTGNAADFIAGADMVDLTGCGETLLGAGFREILQRYPVTETSRDRDFVLRFNTNGTQLNRENIDLILGARVRKILVSIDAADDELFYKIRGIRLGKVLPGVRALIAARNGSGREFPRIGIEMTLMRENLNGVNGVIDLCRDVGADFLEVWSLNEQPDRTARAWVIDSHGWSFRYKEQMLSELPEEELQGIIAGYTDHAARAGVALCSTIFGKSRVSATYPLDKPSTALNIPWQPESIRCILPWRMLRVTYAGDVVVCCWGTQPVGSLRDTPLHEIWNSAAIQEIRRDLIAGRVPRLCAGTACPYIKS